MTEYPKWVKAAHEHIRKDENGHITVPAYPDFHVDRVSKEVTVLVHDAEEEAKAVLAHVEHHEEKEAE